MDIYVLKPLFESYVENWRKLFSAGGDFFALNPWHPARNTRIL